MATIPSKKLPGDPLYGIDDYATDGMLIASAPSNILSSATPTVVAVAPLLPGADPFCPRQVSFTIQGTVPVQVTATENGGNIDGRLKHLSQVDLSVQRTAMPSAVSSIAPAASSEAA